jgi:hypothetical protein
MADGRGVWEGFSQIMDGQVFITQGDITRLSADAIAVTNGTAFAKKTENMALLRKGEQTDLSELRRQAREEREGSGPLWVSLPGARKPYGVVFVSNTKRRAEGEAHPAHQMVTRAVDAAVAGLRERAGRQQGEPPPPGRYLIGLIGFRMGMGGDKHDRSRSGWHQVQAAYEALDRHPDIDIAFVLDERAKYEIFVDARRRFVAQSGRQRPPFPRADLAELIDALKSGECVAFVGAGLSRNSGLKGYEDLIQIMADRVELGGKVGKDTDLYFDVAQMFRDRFGAGAVRKLIAELYGEGAKASPSLAHYLLLSLPIRFVMTTNYDRLLEETLEMLSRYPLRVVDAGHVARTGFRDGTYVVKMHGDVEDGHFVLSRDDYDGFFQKRPEMASLLEGLLLNQSFLFVGYSLRDPNFRQVYGKIGQMLQSARRPAYVLAFEKARPALRAHLKERQHLHLIELGEVDAGEGAAFDPDAPRRLLYLLDRLNEEVTEGTRLFLAPDVQDGQAETVGLPAAFHGVRGALDEAGRRLLEAIDGPLTPDEARTAGRILSFLAELGWQPSREPGRGGRDDRDRDGEDVPPGRSRKPQRKTLHQAWLRLAGALEDEDAASGKGQQQVLTSALRYADSITTARSVRKRIKELDEAAGGSVPKSPDGGGGGEGENDASEAAHL